MVEEVVTVAILQPPGYLLLHFAEVFSQIYLVCLIPVLVTFEFEFTSDNLIHYFSPVLGTIVAYVLFEYACGGSR